MSSGSVVAIFLHSKKAGPMRWTQEIVAETGQGLSGDTYFRAVDEKSDKHAADREVTLIESEALSHLLETHNIILDPAESRRNLVTLGVSLNPLVGVEFWVGPVRLRGLRLCDPCKQLERLTQPGVLRGLDERGGLRAEVLEGGTIAIGCAVTVPTSS